MDQLQDLPPEVQEQLVAFTEAAKAAWGPQLVSVILFGSAAEGRLRLTSDVNLLLVLQRFAREDVDKIREPFRVARATIRLGVMFVLESELERVAAAFAVKFDDILSRHRILYGANPLARLEVSRPAAVARLRQVLLNLRLRLRERYALVSLREEQLAEVIADNAGPLRACAAMLLRLEGHAAESPKEALRRVVADMREASLEEALIRISAAREQGFLPVGSAPAVAFRMMELAERLQERVDRLA